MTVLDKKAVGAQIAHYRDLSRLSQKEVATRCEVALRQYQRWESGDSIPYRRNLEILSEVFSEALGGPVSLDDLLGVTAAEQTPSLDTRLTLIEQQLAAIMEALHI